MKTPSESGKVFFDFHINRLSFPLVFFLERCQYVDMVCIYCGSPTSVTNSRSKGGRLSIWRRRECKRCHAVFTTRETVDYRQSLRVKHSDGSLEPFLSASITKDLQQALDHRLTTSASDSIDLSDTVLVRLLANKPLTPIVSTRVIAQLCYEILQRFDDIAAIKYRSYRPALFT